MVAHPEIRFNQSALGEAARDRFPFDTRPYLDGSSDYRTSSCQLPRLRRVRYQELAFYPHPKRCLRSDNISTVLESEYVWARSFGRSSDGLFRVEGRVRRSVSSSVTEIVQLL